MVKIYNKIIYWLRSFEKVLLIGIHKICLNSVYFIFFLSVIFIIFLYTGMTSCYHLWPVDPIGGFLLMIMAPGLFFIMMGILILIRIIVGLRMSKLGYCNHKNSAASLWLMVFLGVVLCIIVALFVY